MIESNNDLFYICSLIEYIDNYNIAVYYMTPQYLQLSYEEGKLLD